MQTSVDGKIAGPEGYADWVDNWGDNYGLMPQIDACLLGGGMYPGVGAGVGSISVQSSCAGRPAPARDSGSASPRDTSSADAC